MRETFIRSMSGSVYLLLLCGATLLSPFTFLLLFGMFLGICVSEFCDLVRIHKMLPIMLSMAAFLGFAWYPISEMSLLLLLISTLLVSVKSLFFLFDPKQVPQDKTSRYIYLTGCIIFPFILITKIPFINGFYEPELLLSLFILIWANDTFAFLVGKSFGKHKLLELVSPKKTIEGFVGGAIGALSASVFIALYYIHKPIGVWIAVALVVTVFGTLGDLVQSKFKRIAMVKDSGRIMPGHGGILDRLDSVIFAAPFVFLLFQIIKYVS
jgi:phosphatidate cytidylyltransferase